MARAMGKITSPTLLPLDYPDAQWQGLTHKRNAKLACCAAWAVHPSAAPPCPAEPAFPNPSLCCCCCKPIKDCTSGCPVLDSATAGEEPFAATRACCCNNWCDEEEVDARGSFFFGFGFTRSDVVKPVAFRYALSSSSYVTYVWKKTILLLLKSLYYVHVTNNMAPTAPSTK